MQIINQIRTLLDYNFTPAYNVTDFEKNLDKALKNI